jgi:hypothetical protein
MDAAAYPDEELQRVIDQVSIPVRLNLLSARDTAKELRALWTPTVLFLDPEGRERHRFLGFLPPREYSAAALLASALWAFAEGRVDDAAARFDRVRQEFGDTDSAPEATYWSGVCGFRKTKSTQPIYNACREIVEKFPRHLWARKVGFVTRYKDFNF